MARRNNNSNKLTGTGVSVGGKHAPVLIKGATLLNNTANINFSQELGPVLPMPTFDYKVGHTAVTRLGTPTGIAGLMVIDAVPTYGKMTDANSAVNVAAFDLYTMDRAANSGRANYDAPDLMQYIIAMDSASMLISYMKTAYGLMKEYRTLNRFYPRAIVEAMGFDYAKFVDKLPAFRSFINIAVAEFNAKKVPALPIYDYHYNRFSTIYKDSESEKAQLFVYKLKGLYQFIDANPTPNEAGFLEFIKIDDGTLHDLDYFKQLWTDLMLGIQGSETFYTMSGDIQKAWNSFAQIPEMPDDYRTPIVKDSDQLKELHNATITKELVNDSDNYNGPLNIYQDVPTNQLRQKVEGVSTNMATAIGLDYGVSARERIINTDSESPSPAEVVTMTANMTYGQLVNDGSTTAHVNYTDYGLFIYSGAHIWAYRNNSFQNIADFSTYINETADYTTEQSYAHFQAGIDQFSWKPLNYGYQIISEGAAIAMKFQPEPINDLDNFTTVHQETVQAIQKANTLGAFNVPNQGSLTSR